MTTTAGLDLRIGSRAGQARRHTLMIYVCPVCGFTASTPPATCPGSGTAKERFERID